MPFGNSTMRLSRRDILTIARRFNAGTAVAGIRVPKGRLNEDPGRSPFQPSLRDFSDVAAVPALN